MGTTTIYKGRSQFKSHETGNIITIIFNPCSGLSYCHIQSYYVFSTKGGFPPPCFSPPPTSSQGKAKPASPPGASPLLQDIVFCQQETPQPDSRHPPSPLSSAPAVKNALSKPPFLEPFKLQKGLKSKFSNVNLNSKKATFSVS